jgi:formate hydrogenlyase subunit 6/NADH:ubiquinone oxidoreductase subunit I
VSTSSRPRAWHLEIDPALCLQCGGCVSICPTLALDMYGLRLGCEDARCIGCDLCVRFCPVGALSLEERAAVDTTAHEGRR